MIVYGGLNDFQQPMNDIISLNLKTREWTAINKSTPLNGEPKVDFKVQ